jgi:hypothetical protein
VNKFEDWEMQRNMKRGAAIAASQGLRRRVWSSFELVSASALSSLEGAKGGVHFLKNGAIPSRASASARSFI